MRHLTNVAVAYPANDYPQFTWARRLRLVLYAMSWLLCGPVAGLTALLVLLLLAQYGALKLGGWLPPTLLPALLGETAVAVCGALLALAALCSRSEDETWSLFVGWIVGG